MRAPGVVQTCLATEVVIQHISHSLGVDTTTVQWINFIQNGQTTILGR